MFKGFILQSSYRVVAGSATILLFGRLEDGRTFLIRESRRRPYFYVRSKDREAIRTRTAITESTDWQSMDGHSVSKVTVRKPAEVVPIRDALHKQGIHTYEADIRFTTSYLIENNIRGGVGIEGDSIESDLGVDVEFHNPELYPASVSISPSCLAFDIETDPSAKQLLAISVYGEQVDQVFICDPEGRELPDKSVGCKSENETIERFIDLVLTVDPDVLTGWNVVDFDLNVLNRVAQRTNADFELGRVPGRITFREARGYFGSGQAIVPGRLVLDGIDLVRGAFIHFPEYTLERVSQEVLGEGKRVEGDVDDRAGEIVHQYTNNIEAFAEYARTDSRLAYEIVQKLNLLSLAQVRSTLTGMPMDRVAASVASFDFVYIAALKQRKVCAPSFVRDQHRRAELHEGGAVLSPTVGIHENVWVLDYKSLYPSIIRTFNVDPLGFRGADCIAGNHIRLLNGACFAREDAILPEVLDTLFKQREEAKSNQDSIASQAIKILMNSFYGVLATPVCRFHNDKIGNSVTTMGRHFLMWSKSWFEDRGYQVLYGDTDSVFVKSGETDWELAAKLGHSLALQFNLDLSAYIQKEWEVTSKMELEFEKLYTRLFLLPLKKGTGGARKRYAGRLASSGEVEFVGMEAVRRDWTEMAKDAQREMYARLFRDERVEDYVKDCVESVRAGELDDKLVYTKGLSKPPTEYKKTKPPHVVAALKSKSSERVVHYVMTYGGPEPLDSQVHEIDREHYINKQLKAVAEPVLQTLGISWDYALGLPEERSLFDD